MHRQCGRIADACARLFQAVRGRRSRRRTAAADGRSHRVDKHIEFVLAHVDVRGNAHPCDILDPAIFEMAPVLLIDILLEYFGEAAGRKSG
jgi:MoaA/NifB/PqqE/SkfB family radical SAM enzyme